MGICAHVVRQSRLAAAVSVHLLLGLNHGPRDGGRTRVLVERDLLEVVQEEVELPYGVPESLEPRLQAHLRTIANADREEGGRPMGWAEGIVPGPAVGLGEGGRGAVDRYVLTWEGGLGGEFRG